MYVRFLIVKFCWRLIIMDFRKVANLQDLDDSVPFYHAEDYLNLHSAPLWLLYLTNTSQIAASYLLCQKSLVSGSYKLGINATDVIPKLPHQDKFSHLQHSPCAQQEFKVFVFGQKTQTPSDGSTNLVTSGGNAEVTQHKHPVFTLFLLYFGHLQLLTIESGSANSVSRDTCN